MGRWNNLLGIVFLAPLLRIMLQIKKFLVITLFLSDAFLLWVSPVLSDSFSYLLRINKDKSLMGKLNRVGVGGFFCLYDYYGCITLSAKLVLHACKCFTCWVSWMDLKLLWISFTWNWWYVGNYMENQERELWFYSCYFLLLIVFAGFSAWTQAWECCCSYWNPQSGRYLCMVFTMKGPVGANPLPSVPFHTIKGKWGFSICSHLLWT